MRAHGISSNTPSTKPSTPTKSKPERKESTSTSKKRKLVDLEETQNDGGADDDETFGPLTQTPIVKSETKKPLARLTTQSIKAEDKDTPKLNIMTSSPIPLDEAADLMQFYPESASQTFSEASFSSARDFNDYTSGNDYSSNFGGPSTPVHDGNDASMFAGFDDPFTSAYPESDPLNIFGSGIQSNVHLAAPVVPSNADAMMNPLAPRPQMASQVFRSSQFSPFGLSDNPVVLE